MYSGFRCLFKVFLWNLDVKRGTWRQFTQFNFKNTKHYWSNLGPPLPLIAASTDNTMLSEYCCCLGRAESLFLNQEYVEEYRSTWRFVGRKSHDAYIKQQTLEQQHQTDRQQREGVSGVRILKIDRCPAAIPLTQPQIGSCRFWRRKICCQRADMISADYSLSSITSLTRLLQYLFLNR